MNLFWIAGIVGAVVFVAMCAVALWALVGANSSEAYEEDDDTYLHEVDP